jgi:hypothetical protein
MRACCSFGEHIPVLDQLNINLGGPPPMPAQDAACGK